MGKMEINGWLPYRLALRSLVMLSLLQIGVQALTFQYCSPQNSGAGDFQGVNIYNSWGSCPGKCVGYAFAIVQFQSCWCSNIAPSAQDSLSNCDTPCPGYPANQCGNRVDNLYGYLALGPAPVGTVGPTPRSSALSSGKPTTSAHRRTSTFLTTTSPGSGTSSTIYVSTTIRTVTVDPTPSVSDFTVTRSVSVIPPTVSSTPQGPSTITYTAPTHISVTTISGAPVTLTVTSIPSQSHISPVSAAHHQSLSNGATAGIVIGVIFGVAALALLAFLAWRRRRTEPEKADEKGRKPPRRTTSVLSRTGLLSRGRQSMIEQPADESLYTGGTGTTGPNSVRQSMLFGAAGGAAAGAAAAGNHENPSPSGSGHYYSNGVNSGLARRSSQPLVYDQRLNPSALFGAHDNGSRISMQDNNDYSRPLGIANPDPRPSHESRRSNWD